MKIQDLLNEVRKNPDQNPKTSINSIITQAYNDTTEELDKSGIRNLFISFTEVDKLGINPKSKYDTPLGIYSYPAYYVIQEVGNIHKMDELPFAGNSPFVNIFSSSGNIIDLSDMDAAEARKYMADMTSLWAKGADNWKEAVDQAERIIVAAEDKAMHSDYPGGRLWYVSMKMASLFAKRWGTKPSVAWNKLFRAIGVDGCIDTGAGIIHTSEPTQCVFFSTATIKNVKRFHNKYSPLAVRDRKSRGQAYAAASSDLFRKFAAMSTEEIVEYFKYSTVAHLQYVKDKKARMIIAQKRPALVQYFRNPTPQEITVAMNDAIANMRYFPGKVTDDMVVDAIQKHPDDGRVVLLYMPKPSSKVQVALVTADPHMIFSLPNPSPAAFKASLADGTVNPNLIKQYAAKQGLTL